MHQIAPNVIGFLSKNTYEFLLEKAYQRVNISLYLVPNAL